MFREAVKQRLNEKRLFTNKYAMCQWTINECEVSRKSEVVGSFLYYQLNYFSHSIFHLIEF